MNTQKLFLSVVCALAAVPAFASSDIISSNNQISLQSLWTKVDYVETNNMPVVHTSTGTFLEPTGVLDTEKGTVRGYDISLSLMEKIIWNNDYLRFQYGHNHGNTDYVGQTLIGASNVNNYGSLRRSDASAFRDMSLRYGTGFTLTDSGMITPYFEYGDHRWVVGGHAGEDFSNNYYGLGVLGQYSPIHGLVLSANALLGHTKNSNIGLPATLSTDLGNSAYYQYGLSADYAFTKSFHGNIGADYTQFKYGMSDPSDPAGFEPNSKTKYTTYKIGVGLSF